ncbi:DUF6262 family protein [Streptomyces sp. NPDC054783]
MPPEPNTAPLVAAARKRHELARAKAIQALRELDRTGAPVSFEGVVQRAGISRSWLYGQPDVRAGIERLRDVSRRSSSPQVPAAERSSDASLHARLEVALERNRQLAEENQRLRRQLAHTLGDQQASTRTGPPGSDSRSAQIVL